MTTTEKIEKWVLNNAKLLVGVFIGVLVVSFVYGAYEILSQQKEDSAHEAYFEVEAALEKKQQALLEAETKKGEKAPAKDKNPELLKAELGENVTQLEQFIKDNSNTSAARIATVHLADLYVEYKDWSSATTLLENSFAKTSENDLFYGLIGSQLGLAYSDSKQCEKAIAVYDKIVSAKAQKHIHAQALLKKGVCLMTLNQLDKAESVFRQAKAEFPDEVSGQSALAFERLIGIKKGQLK